MHKINRIINRLFFTILLVLILIIISSVIFTSIYPIGYTEYINKYSEEYNLDPFLVSSIINVESKYNKDAISHRDARGLMQIGPSTGEWASEELSIQNYDSNMLFNPEINIQMGTWYLDKLISEFGPNVDLVLAAYNGGSGNVQNWIKDERYSSDGKSLHTIPFPETENYVKSVKKSYKIYKLIYKDYINNSDNLFSKYMKYINYVRIYFKSQ